MNISYRLVYILYLMLCARNLSDSIKRLLQLRFDFDSTASEKVGAKTVKFYANEGTNPYQTTFYFRDIGCKCKHLSS